LRPYLKNIQNKTVKYLLSKDEALSPSPVLPKKNKERKKHLTPEVEPRKPDAHQSSGPQEHRGVVEGSHGT
jgi:hypothetical protein